MPVLADHDNTKPKAGVIAGIAIGVIVFVTLIVGLLLVVWRRRSDDHSDRHLGGLKTAPVPYTGSSMIPSPESANVSITKPEKTGREDEIQSPPSGVASEPDPDNINWAERTQSIENPGIQTATNMQAQFSAINEQMRAIMARLERVEGEAPPEYVSSYTRSDRS
ncbi:hypothetical protein AAF712_002522 [Marasmius tenuissimus]|uniref:Uncharacterized protein n=1 Tax=Marasmius tenuissimus TaxID=585030 RepID=A0ABR3AAE6_9AGAR